MWISRSTPTPQTALGDEIRLLALYIPQPIGQEFQEFTNRLQYELWCPDFDGHSSSKGQTENQGQKPEGRHGENTISVFHGTKDAFDKGETSSTTEKRTSKAKAYCPYCNNNTHYLGPLRHFIYPLPKPKRRFISIKPSQQLAWD